LAPQATGSSNLHGFIHDITIDPEAGRGTITFYELPESVMVVPGPGVEPGWPEGQGILRWREKGSEHRT
jgi:hypothetical protein